MRARGVDWGFTVCVLRAPDREEQRVREDEELRQDMRRHGSAQEIAAADALVCLNMHLARIFDG